MIQIVKHGNKAYLRGTCNVCGCEVVCNPSDTYCGNETTVPSRYVRCPECGGRITVNENLVVRELVPNGFDGIACSSSDTLEGSVTLSASNQNTVSVSSDSGGCDSTSVEVNRKFSEFCKINGLDV